MGAKILLADDDLLIHRLYGHVMERAGYEVLGVTNGREALDVIAREKPQLAILDILMPEPDGLTVLQQLKREPETKSSPVLLISAEPSYYAFRREFIKAGAAEFLTKPFSPSRLLEVMNRLLS